MTTTVRAVFDGKVLRPDRPIDLEINRHYVLNIEPLKKTEQIDSVESDSAFDLASLAVKTDVPDLATEHDHYLYGTPKREAYDGE